MYRHDCMPAGIIAVPQEVTRLPPYPSPASGGGIGRGHLEAGALQRRDDRAAGQRRQRPHGPGGGGWHELIDRRSEIPVRRWNRLAIPPESLLESL
jgi:hypothetical protein